MTVESINTFQQIDSLYQTVYDPKVSPGKSKGWKPYNRMRWFLGQRALPDGTFPFEARMQAWEIKQSARNRSTLDESWTSAGPTNMAGRILSIAWDPVNTNIIYAGSASGGLWKSTDGGGIWYPKTDDLPSLAIGTVALDPQNHNTVFIGTGEGSWNVDAVYGAGIFKSTDGGTTWTATGMSWQQSSRRTVNKIIIHPTNSQIMWAATNIQSSGGVYKSTNGGTNWTRYLYGEAKDLEIDPSNPNVLYACLGYPYGDSGNGVYKSTDGGVTWTLSSTGLPSGSTMGRMEVSVSPANPQVLYLGVSQTLSAGAGLLGIYRTTNGGASWTQQASSPNMYSGQGWYNIVCEAHPTNSSIVYSSGLDCYKSSDGGTTWYQKTWWYYSSGHTQYAHADHHALAFKPNDPNTIIVGTDGGLFKSTNGGEVWTGINTNLVTYQYYAMCNDALNPLVAFGGTQDNGTNRYGNATQHQWVLGGDGGYCNVDFTNSSIVYATTQNGSHYKSTNSGLAGSFQSCNTGISGSGAWVTPRVMDPTNPSILYTGTKKVYRTSNSASSWSAISSDLSTQYISTIAVAPSNTSVIYVGIENNGQVWKTTNTGVSWTLVNSGLPYRYITRVAVDPNDENTAYTTVSSYGTGHVWKTTNGGSSWVNSSTGLPDIPVNAIVVDQNSPNNLYIGTDLGVYASTDGGASWVDYSSGLPNVVVDDLALHPTSGVLRAATHGRGMWQTPTAPPALTVVSPNGGEQWIVGSSQTITWGTGGLGGNVSIELNRSYPSGGWATISSSTSNDGSFAWTVSGPTTTSARIRITSVESPTVSDISNNNFSVTSPLLTLSSPNGGETWIAGNSQTISWTLSGTTGSVVVQLDRSYPSGSWETLTTTAGSSYNWTVTAPATSSARIRVYLSTVPTIGDTSATNFSVVEPSVTVVYPNGGEALTPGGTYAIRWTKTNSSSTVKVELNRSYSGGTWEQLAASVSADSFPWTVDQTASTSARVRVTLNSYTSATDVSNSNFTILTPALSVTSPNGGEVYNAGSVHTIRWSRTNLSGGVNVYVNRAYSSGSWEPLAVSVTADTFAWSVTQPYSNAARIRVASAALPTFYDESNTNFTIGTAIVLSSPNGGENWAVGLPQTISWVRYNAAGAATVQINRNYPSGSWETLTTSETNSTYSWTVTAPTTSHARMRVFLTAAPGISDTSNSDFTIPTAGLALTSPNGGELWTTGTSQTITWSRNNANGNVSVLLNRNYPTGSWETLTTTVSTNSYTWPVAGANSSNARIQIQLTSSPTVNDLSDADFSIGTPQLTLLAPAGGETWLTGSVQTIRWTREYAPGNVVVQINRYYPGGSWTTLSSSVAGDSLQWTVTGPATTTNRVKIYLSSNSAVNTVSAANFTIVTPQVTLTAPNGGETWIIGNAQTVTFARANAEGPATVEINRNYPGGSWETITSTETGTSVSWTATDPASSACRVRVYLNAASSAGDTSSANFSLVGSSVTVTAPNGGEQLIVGDTSTIAWNRFNADGAVTVSLNRSYPGGSWETLNSSVTGSSVAWPVTGPATSAARVRVALNSNPAVVDESNSNFTIVQPALTLSLPDGGETITLGGAYTIRWSRTAAPGNVTVLLNREYPSGAWETLTTAATADSFVWNTSGAASGTCRIKIHLTEESSINDISAANFTLIQRILELTSHHDGDVYYTGSFSSVGISRFNATGNVTVQLNRNYPSGSWETLSSVISGTSYSWNVSGSASSHARLRIFLNTQPFIGDTSAVDFTIATPSLSLTTPAGGEEWATGTSQSISWQRFGVSDNVRIEISRSYPEGSWSTLASSVSGTSYAWTVSTPATDQARIRIVSSTNPSIGDTSDADFSIVTPAITLLEPDGGETVKIGFPATIRWTRIAAAGNARVELNRSYPAGSWELLATTDADSFQWAVAGAASTTARVRVYLISNPSLRDSSSSNFTIFQPSLALTTPSGSERWMRGTSHTIAWSRTGLDGSVRVELNSNFPSGAWSTLTQNETGNSYTWAITQSATAHARIRVVYQDQPAFADTSDDFSIAEPSLTITSPNGGELLVIGQSYSLTFNRTDHPEPVTVEINRTYPSSAWETIATGVTGSSVSWTAAGVYSFNARMRVLSQGFTGVGDTSNANFRILPTGVTLVSPDGGEILPVGSITTLRWARVTVGNVDVLLNRNYPTGIWEMLAQNINSDSISWTVQGDVSSSCRLKVRATADPNTSDQSASDFEILQPVIELTTPVVGDTFAIGVANRITWSRNPAAIGNVRIDLNRNYPSGVWTTIGSSTGSELYWMATGPVTSTARLRVIAPDYTNVGDTLDFNLSIINASLTLTAPTGGDVVVGQPVTIRWTRDNVGIGANVYLCRNFPGGTWVLIASSINSDEYTWTATSPGSSSAAFKVISTRIPALGDTSATFAILQPSVTLVTPNGGTIGAGNTQEISWTRTDFSGPVSLDLSLNYLSGAWQSIASNQTGTSYTWTVPGTLTTHARVRVRSASPAVEDISDSDITIVTPQLTVTSPNGGEILTPGQNISITWTRSTVPGNVNVELNRNYPDGEWETIAANVAGINAAWTVNGDFAHGRIRVSMSTRPEINDISDSDFGTRLPDLYVSNPNGGDTLIIDQPYVLRWGRVATPGLVRVELNRNYPDGTWEVLHTATTADSLLWTISSPPTTAARLRVTLIANPSQTDVSDADFTIAHRAVILKAPIAGDSLAIGRPTVITWNTVGLPSNVNIYVKYNYPSGSWSTIAINASGGSYTWTPSSSTSETARIRILSASAPTVGDTTDGAVRIGNPQVLFTTPSTVDTFLVGEQITTRWNRRFAVGTMRVDVSRTGAGGPWQEVGTSDGDSLVWTVTAPATNTMRLRASLIDATWITGITPSNCVILEPSLVMNSPLAGSAYAIGRTLNISWTRNSVTAPLNVYLKRSPEGEEELIAENITGSSVQWTATAPATNNAQIIVRTADGFTVEAQSGSFALSMPDISFAGPLGGESFVAGAAMNIHWQRTAVADPVRLELNRDYPAGAWTVIASSVSDTFFNWTVTGPTTQTARLRLISTVDPVLGDTTGDEIELLVPSLFWDTAGRSDLLIGFISELRWQRVALSGPVNVYLSRDNGATWPMTIAQNITGDFIEWTPSSPAAVQARLKVQSAANPTINAVSDVFELLQPELVLNVPAGGEVIAIGTPLSIRWNRINHPAPVDIELSRTTPPDTWETLATDLDADSLLWISTGPATSTAQIRIRSTIDAAWTDESAAFSLQWAALAITEPETNTELVVGDSVTIAWQRTAYDNPVRVLLRRNGGTIDTLRHSITANTIRAAINSPAATNAWIIVEDAASRAPRDSVFVNGPFIPGITLTAPTDESRWIVDRGETIAWSRSHAEGEASVYVNPDYPGGMWNLIGTTTASELIYTPLQETATMAVVVVIPARAIADTVFGVNVVRPTLTLTPLAQTSYRLGTVMDIAWSSHEVDGTIYLELNRHFPQGTWELLYEGTASSYQWTVSGDTTGTARLRIRSDNYPSAADTSEIDIALYQPGLTLSFSPAADTFYIGNEVTLYLDMSGMTTAANIALQRLPEQTWETLFENVLPGSYDWTVTGPEVLNARFRAFVPGDDELDDTTSVFAIQPPHVAFSTEWASVYTVGDTIHLSWTAHGSDGPFRLQLDRGAEPLELIAENISDLHYDWVVTPPRTDLARLIIEDQAAALSDTGSVFTIRVPELVFVAPVSSGIDTAGSSLHLAWEWIDGDGAVMLEVSFDSLNGTWQRLSDSLAATEYDYSIVGPETDSLRFRVRALSDTTIIAVSPVRSIIVPSLSLTNPGGTTWYVGEQHWIHWSRSHYEGPVTVEITPADRAEPWQELAHTVMTDSFLWTVTGPEADLVALRISASLNPDLNDTTDAPLRIALPSLQVVAPNGGETLQIGEDIRVRWRSEGVSGDIGVALWRGAPVNEFDTLFTGTPNDSSEIWTITGPAATECFLIVVSLNDTSVWDTSDTRFVIEDPDAAEQNLWDGLPTEYSLGAPFPNPFNSASQIEFALPRDGNVRLVIYDLMGREVATLVEEARPAGRYRASWNADRAASGVYFARMTSGDFTAVRKLHLVK
ncbi:MAG: T9SS type A sorting domain-containing protein [Calditrichota bacterium]